MLHKIYIPLAELNTTVTTTGKELYGYQKDALQEIFRRFDDAPKDYHLLYQLPTGGGKTVIFSEIVRRYLEKFKKKVLVLTHRIELSKQTSKMLDEFGVANKIINSTAKLDDQDQFSCFVAMVETLKNRLNDDKLDISDIGLVIVDEAHYNSFTKIFKFFDQSFILGVTATPLSSNIKLPMYENYQELFVGETIQHLIESGYLASANMYSYNVGLTSLEVGANGDYTVFNPDLSTDFIYLDEVKKPEVSIKYRSEKWSARFKTSYLSRTLENNDELRPEFNIKRDFEAIELSSRFRYKFSPKSSTYFGYRLDNSPPRLSQLQAFENVSDPLNTIIGNPNLDPTNSHRVYAGYNAFDFQKRTGFYTYLNANFVNNAVVSKSIIDEDFVRITTYDNVNGNYNINLQCFYALYHFGAGDFCFCSVVFTLGID